MSLKILPLPLTQAQNGDKQFWKEKFHVANWKAQHIVMMGLIFSFLGCEWGELFFVENMSKYVTNVCPY
jgi:hypothetical protein